MAYSMWVCLLKVCNLCPYVKDITHFFVCVTLKLVGKLNETDSCNGWLIALVRCSMAQTNTTHRDVPKAGI